MVLDDSGERFHELDHFGLPALDESLVFGFLEILVEFSHAKNMILVHGRRSRPEIWRCFQARKQRINQNDGIFALKTAREHSTGLSGSQILGNSENPPYV